MKVAFFTRKHPSGVQKMFGNRHENDQNHPKRRSFFSTLAIGASVVMVTVVVCGTVLGMYGMDVLDRKAGVLFDFASVAIENAPEIAESLPPALADLVNHERDPEYAKQIDVEVKLVESIHGGRRPVVVVTNRGDNVVSLMSMRVVVLSKSGEPVSEGNEWAATPFAADEEWRGPLLPGVTRRFAADSWLVGERYAASTLKAEAEITEIRVWPRESESPSTLARLGR
jgi:hypothetical protein